MEETQITRQKGKPRGRNGGRPPGIFTPLKTKHIYDPEELADVVASQIVQGKGLSKNPRLGPVTDYDRKNLARITGESVEAFNERLAQKLRTIADKVTDRIEEKVDQDAFKTGELGFILSVAHDKRLSLDGSRALQNASVNLQVHYHGSAPKEALLADLDGLSPRPSPNIIDITPTESTHSPISPIPSNPVPPDSPANHPFSY